MSRTKTHEGLWKGPGYSTSGPSSRRQAPVESVSLPEICDPVPDAKGESCLINVAASKSLQELAREVARKGQPAGREEDSETSDENGDMTWAEVRTGSFWTTTPPFAHVG